MMLLIIKVLFANDQSASFKLQSVMIVLPDWEKVDLICTRAAGLWCLHTGSLLVTGLLLIIALTQESGLGKLQYVMIY